MKEPVTCSGAEKTVRLRVNGREFELAVRETETLLETLRNRLGLTGTKEGCGKGECGACSVIMDGRLVNSCLVLTLQADGSDILTVEGLSKDGKPSKLQMAFIEEGAVQCGFCIPGMLMAAHALLSEKKEPDEEEIRKGISGNICRCTGYIKIVKAIKRAARSGRGL